MPVLLQGGFASDSQIEIRKISPLFAEEGSADGQTQNLGTFNTRAAVEKHERAVQYFKRQA
jgi:hypothetical protein